jgi:hypothetical protein
LFPIAQQFHAAYFWRKRSFRKKEAVQVVVLTTYTLYAIPDLSRIAGKRKNPPDCFPKITQSPTLQNGAAASLVNHAKSQSRFLESNRPKSQAQQGFHGFQKSLTFLHICNVFLNWMASCSGSAKSRFGREKIDFYTSKRRFADGQAAV